MRAHSLANSGFVAQGPPVSMTRLETFKEEFGPREMFPYLRNWHPSLIEPIDMLFCRVVAGNHERHGKIRRGWRLL